MTPKGWFYETMLGCYLVSRPSFDRIYVRIITIMLQLWSLAGANQAAEPGQRSSLTSWLSCIVDINPFLSLPVPQYNTAYSVSCLLSLFLASKDTFYLRRFCVPSPALRTLSPVLFPSIFYLPGKTCLASQARRFDSGSFHLPCRESSTTS